MYLGQMGAAGDTQIIETASEDACRAAGGVPIGAGSVAPSRSGGITSGEALAYGIIPAKRLIRCAIVSAPSAPSAPANISVTVSPQIQTQVSPQISPVFQQQFQPSNSPATAGTTQTTAPPAPPVGPIGVNSTSMQPTAPVQLPPAPAPTYAPPPVSYAPAQPEQLPPSPLPSSAAPIAAPQVSPATVTPAFDWKIAAIISAGLFGAMALSSKGK